MGRSGDADRARVGLESVCGAAEPGVGWLPWVLLDERGVDARVLGVHLLPLLPLEVAVRDVAAVQHAASRHGLRQDRRLLRRTLRRKHALDGCVLLLAADELPAWASRVKSGRAANLVCDSGLLERAL